VRKVGCAFLFVLSLVPSPSIADPVSGAMTHSNPHRDVCGVMQDLPVIDHITVEKNTIPLQPCAPHAVLARHDSRRRSTECLSARSSKAGARSAWLLGLLALGLWATRLSQQGHRTNRSLRSALAWAVCPTLSATSKRPAATAAMLGYSLRVKPSECRQSIAILLKLPWPWLTPTTSSCRTPSSTCPHQQARAMLVFHEPPARLLST
jgi:hypothetical protein